MLMENPTKLGWLWEYDHFNVFNQEKDLKESILIQNPVLFNILNVKRMDEFMVQLLKEKKSEGFTDPKLDIWKDPKKNLDTVSPLGWNHEIFNADVTSSGSGFTEHLGTSIMNLAWVRFFSI